MPGPSMSWSAIGGSSPASAATTRTPPAAARRLAENVQPGELGVDSLILPTARSREVILPMAEANSLPLRALRMLESLDKRNNVGSS